MACPARQHRIQPAQRLERRAHQEHLGLHEHAAGCADVRQCICVEVSEHVRRRHAWRAALRVQHFKGAVRIEEGAEGPLGSKTMLPSRCIRRCGQRP